MRDYHASANGTGVNLGNNGARNMFSNINDWQSDKQLELDGVPLDVGRGRVLYLRRAGGANRAFMVALAEVLRRVMGDRDPADVPDMEIDGELQTIYAEHVVVGWRGFKGDDGEDVPYTRANFLKLMELAPDLWGRVRSTANTRESFQNVKDRKAIARDKEIIKKVSRGKRNGAASAHA
jgi:hypothetical protein